MARWVTVEPVLFGFMFCIFLVFPIQEQLIYKKICHRNFNETVCKDLTSNKRYAKYESFVQKQTSNWMLYASMATTFPSMFAALVLGPCSDRIGRKFTLVLPLIGGAIDAGFLILNSYFVDWHVSLILVGVTISGFFGNFATILMGVFAYMSDISAEKNRTLRLSLLESTIFVGGCLGELIGGLLVDKAGYFVAFALAAGIHVCNLLYVACILQESYYPSEKLQLKEALTDCSNLTNSLKIFTKKRQNKGRQKLLLLLIALFFTLMVYIGSNTVKILFVLRAPLSLSSTMIGYFLAVTMLYRGVGVIAGMPFFIHCLKLKDYTMVILGCFTNSLMLIAFAFSTKLWIIFLVPLIDIFGGISVPCMRSICSKMVGKEEKGAVFSAIASLEVLCSVMASVTFNSIYSATVDWHPNFSFFIMAAVLLVPIFIAGYLKIDDATLQYSVFAPETQGSREHDDNKEAKSTNHPEQVLST